MDRTNRIYIDIEINQKPESPLDYEVIKEEVICFFTRRKVITPGVIIQDTILPDHITYIRVCDIYNEKYDREINIFESNVQLRYHVFNMLNESPQTELLNNEEEVSASEHWMLPNIDFEGLWESLIYEQDIKIGLIKYVKTTLLLSKKQVSANVVCWNNVVLLHGPPGTGKTSLCKALAHKLSIHLNEIYPCSQLIELNTHSMFSKWFSESAKLVMKTFQKIREWLENKNCFVIVLIDEVESLTHARQASMSGKDPSDSLRVVNAVLTQIDQLKRFPNILILATSNITGAIDVAFADRADIKLYIGYPSAWAVYQIFKSCLDELIDKGLVSGKKNDLFDAGLYKKLSGKDMDNGVLSGKILKNSKELFELSTLCQGLSGRTLRKMPFLSIANFIDDHDIPTISQFFNAMKTVAEKTIFDNDKFFNGIS